MWPSVAVACVFVVWVAFGRKEKTGGPHLLGVQARTVKMTRLDSQQQHTSSIEEMRVRAHSKSLLDNCKVLYF